MSVELQLVLWWILFGGTHMLGSSVPVRTRLIRALGLPGFKGLYSLVALATFIPLVWTAWNNRHEGAFLFAPADWNRLVTEVLMFLSVLLIVLSIARPGPATTVAEMSGRASAKPRGIQRITRHPQNTGFALFGVAHMVSNPTAGDWIFWGGFVVYSVASAIHQDRRTLAADPERFRTFYAQTSLVPFAAMLQGRQRLALGEVNWIAVIVAAALFVVVRLIHPLVIGGYG